jgi:hypothetical protein
MYIYLTNSSTCSYIALMKRSDNKQLLHGAMDEVFVISRIIKIEVSVISQAEGVIDNTYLDLDNFWKSQKPNSLTVLLYITFPLIILSTNNESSH